MIDTSDPGKAANVAARAAILFARVSGFVAENQTRQQCDSALAYDAVAFENAITELFPEAETP